MNNQRRKQLQRALDLIDQADVLLVEALDLVQDVQADESDALSNLPESLQDGERGQRMQEAIDRLDEVTLNWLPRFRPASLARASAFEDALEEARDAITAAME